MSWLSNNDRTINTPSAFRNLDLALVIGLGALIHGWIISHDVAIIGFTDALDYLFLADYFRGLVFGGLDSEAVEDYRNTRFPPLYPALLGFLGAGSDSQWLALAISNATSLAAVAAVWFWARGVFGRLAANFISLGLLLYPTFFLLNLYTVSEPLSIALISTTFMLAHAGRRNPRLMVLAAILAGVCPLVRAANLPILPAFGLFVAINRDWSVRQTAPLVLATSLPSFLWFLGRQFSGADSYAASFDINFMLAQMGGWPAAIWLQPFQLFSSLVANWGSPRSLIGLAFGVSFTVLAAAGCWQRVRERHLDAFFLCGYIALILVWPYPSEFQRLLVPIYPILIGCVIHALRTLSCFTGKPTHNRMAASWLIGIFWMAMLGAQAPTTVRYFSRATADIDESLVNEKRRLEYFTMESTAEALTLAEQYARVRAAAEAARRLVPEGACIYGADPRLLRSLAKASAVGYPLDISSRSIAEQRLTACDYYFVTTFGVREIGMPSGYPMASLMGWTHPLLTSLQTTEHGTIVVAALLVRRPAGTDTPQP